MSAATTRWEVGFVGIGSMGWPMAERLVRAGHVVRVYDQQDGRAAAFARQVGGEAAPSLHVLAQASDAIVTMLPTSAIVARVLQDGDDNLLAGMRAGAVVLEMSSGVPSITQRLAERVAALGAHLVDAPVSGGVARAKAGELAIMAGGDGAAIDAVEPVLRAIGTSVLRTGPSVRCMP